MGNGPTLIRDRHRQRYAVRRMAEFPERLRAQGLAVTPQRLAVIRTLLTTTTHPRAEDVYAEVRREHPHISLATVHRTLEVLCQAGEARKVTNLHDSARYDGNVGPHHHLVCVRCRRVLDIDAPGFDGLMGGCRSIGDFKVLGCSVEILAVCGECQKRSSKSEKED